MERYISLSLKENIKKSEAYWISPKGNILAMGDSNHISEVIKNPKSFGYSLQELKDIYDKFGERFGIEGRAREYIIKDLINKHWVRIRKYTRPDKWTINIKLLDDKARDYIQFWAQEMIKLGYGIHSDIYIDSVNFNKNFSMNDIKNDVLYKEHKSNKRYDCMFVEML